MLSPLRPSAGDICIISEKLKFVLFLVPKAASSALSALATSRELGGRKYLNCHHPSVRPCLPVLLFFLLGYEAVVLE